MVRYACGRPKWVALDERSKVSFTFGAYIKGLTFLTSIMIATLTVIEK